MRVGKFVIGDAIRVNIAFNMVAQFYVMGVGFLMAPVYLQYMGKEAYGLVGFFTMLTAWFVLLDVGMTPTVMREIAIFRGGEGSATGLRNYLSACEIIFWGVASVAAIVLLWGAGWAATDWLKAETLPSYEVISSLQLMAIIIPIRWTSGYYKAIVNGYEKQTVLALLNIAFSSARFLAIILILRYISNSPVSFFVYQLVVSLVEIFTLVAISRRLMPRAQGERKIHWRSVGDKLGATLAIGISGTIWVFLTQFDKLLMSSTLTLKEYGAYSLAVTAASALGAINAPFNQAILPRMTKLFAAGDKHAGEKLYVTASHILAVISIPVIAMMTLFGTDLLSVWTHGNSSIFWAAPIMALYSVGNFFVSVHSFSYYLQYASGNLKIHFFAHVAMLTAIIPCYLIAAHYGSPVTAAGTWACANALYFLIICPWVYDRIFGNPFRMMGGLITLGVIAIICGLLIARIVEYFAVVVNLPVIFIVYFILLLACGLSSFVVRERIIFPTLQHAFGRISQR
ncbi:oligosaccharide flippase family protein [Rhizobium sp. BK376]|uniref:lipopolysaccharide biosynthesis protein n=1 Tax=Rhizobium sp. BK376 TaxID=2512149 RepID=UPI0010443839|nr:oligosaccharide flippase family protein [Rhizobium sp. BK376]TCR71857.1 O-antigen/teichoic acid export membrane protein [Rhizobium sp. BK376]